MSLVRNPNIYYGMGRRRRRTRRRGGSFFSSIGDALSRGARFVKDNGLLSKAVGLIPHPLGQLGSIGLRAFGLGRRRRRRVGVRKTRRVGGRRHATFASSFGLGRKRRVGRPRMVHRRRGGALKDTLIRLHNLAKEKRLLSSALGHFGHHKLASVASALGYGRKRSVTHRRRRVTHRRSVGGMRPRMIHRRMGGANFFSTDQLAIPKF